MSLNESHVEDAALEWLGALDDVVLHGPDIAAGLSCIVIFSVQTNTVVRPALTAGRPWRPGRTSAKA